MIKEILLISCVWITVANAYPADSVEPQSQNIQHQKPEELEIFDVAESKYGGGGGGHYGGGHHGGGHHGGGHHGGGHHGGGHNGGGHHGGGGYHHG